ncbi:hypothetical protein JD79_00972 [Geodermatophilus normandii]|uniref:Uncharacterized protein n=1 Tax=Geodermatophilus normandii TaxID=1137989 RepID=A0A317QFU6_9ACTN|nr:hypothetical protein JD79_00972 [Geodermatophilus normandii]
MEGTSRPSTSGSVPCSPAVAGVVAASARRDGTPSASLRGVPSTGGTWRSGVDSSSHRSPRDEASQHREQRLADRVPDFLVDLRGLTDGVADVVIRSAPSQRPASRHPLHEIACPVDTARTSERDVVADEPQEVRGFPQGVGPRERTRRDGEHVPTVLSRHRQREVRSIGDRPGQLPGQEAGRISAQPLQHQSRVGVHARADDRPGTRAAQVDPPGTPRRGGLQIRPPQAFGEGRAAHVPRAHQQYAEDRRGGPQARHTTSLVSSPRPERPEVDRVAPAGELQGGRGPPWRMTPHPSMLAAVRGHRRPPRLSRRQEVSVVCSAPESEPPRAPGDRTLETEVL